MSDMIEIFETISPLLGVAGSVLLAVYESAGHKDRILKSYLPWVLVAVVVLLAGLCALASVCGFSYWWLALSCIPLLYVPYRKLMIYEHKREIAEASGDIARQDMQYAYLQYLDNLKLSPREVEKEYLPAMLVLFEIGAHKKFKAKLSELESYSSCYHYKLYQAYMAYAGNDFKTFLERIRDIDEEKIPLYERQRLVINRICAYDNLGRKEDEKYQLEALRQRLETTGHLFVEGYEDLARYYINSGDEASRVWLFNKIRSERPLSFSRYIRLIDIIFHYNRSRGNVKENDLLIKEVTGRLSEYGLSEEERLMFEIRMLVVYFENGSNWMSYADSLFASADHYLDCSMDVAFAYLETVSEIIKRAMSALGVGLPPDFQKNLYEKMERGISRYIPQLDRKIAETEDCFLYRKRSLLRWKITYYYLLMNVRNDYSEADQLVRTMKNTIHLTELNGDYRERLHSMIVFIDDVIVLTEHMKQNGRPELCRNYLNEAKGMLAEADKILEEGGFNPSCAYYTMYSAYFHTFFGDLDTARIRYHQFIRSGGTAEHFTRPVQNIFNMLRDKFEYA